jgi:hypothetical protein
MEGVWILLVVVVGVIIRVVVDYYKNQKAQAEHQKQVKREQVRKQAEYQRNAIKSESYEEYFLRIQKEQYEMARMQEQQKQEELTKSINQIKKINQEYKFYKLSQQEYDVYVLLQKLEKKTSNKYFGSWTKERFNYEKLYQMHFFQNYDEIKGIFSKIEHNRKFYEEYLAKVNAIRYSTMISEKLPQPPLCEWRSILHLYGTPDPWQHKIPRMNKEFSYDELLNFWKSTNAEKSRKDAMKRERDEMSASLRYQVFKRDNYACCICGRTKDDGVKLHADHIRPVAKGGRTELDNLQTLCERCNWGKGTDHEGIDRVKDISSQTHFTRLLNASEIKKLKLKIKELEVEKLGLVKNNPPPESGLPYLDFQDERIRFDRNYKKIKELQDLIDELKGLVKVSG